MKFSARSMLPAPLYFAALNASDVFAPQGLAYGGTCLDQSAPCGLL